MYNKEYHHQYYLRKKEQYQNDDLRREQNRVSAENWRRKNRKASMVSAAKYRAKQQGMDFNIDVSDIIIPEHCPILRIPLTFTDGKQHDGTPALDRIDNSKGYIKGNVQVISHKANRHKSDLSLEQIENLYNYIKVLKNDT